MGRMNSPPLFLEIMKSIRVKMLRTMERLERGETYILRASDAEMLMASGAAVSVEPPRDIKPAGPSEIKPIEPSEIKKKVRTRKS